MFLIISFADNRNCDWGWEIENICQAVYGAGGWRK